MQSIELPKSLKVIGREAFYCCQSLKELNIPEGVVKIGGNAIDGCISLETVTLPSTITSIGEETFYNTKLTCLKVLSSNVVLNDETFECCYYLKEIHVPKASVDYYKKLLASSVNPSLINVTVKAIK